MEQVKKALNESAPARWGILFLVGLILSVNYYFYDAFSTLKDLLTREFSFTNTQYGLFVSFYSIPNTFLLMAVIGGMTPRYFLTSMLNLCMAWITFCLSSWVLDKR